MDSIEAMQQANLKRNSTGYGGVRKVRNLWQARVTVTVNGRRKRIQSQGFDTREQAAAWRAARVQR